MTSRRKGPSRSAILVPVALALLTGLPASPAFPQADAVEIPLSGPAAAHAQAAFAAFDRKDYPTAIAEVREALRQRPDVTRLKRLLVYALAGNGDLAEAAKTAQGFIAAGDTDPEIAAELAQIDAKLHPPPPSPATLGYEAAAEGYKAYATGDYAGAVAAARRALGYQPDNADYQALLSNAEAALNAPKPVPPPPGFAAAQAGYAAMKAKAYAKAAASAAEAVRLEPANRDYRLLLVQALAGAGHTAAAIEAASAALKAAGPDPRLFAARGYAEQRLGRSDAAADDFAAALAHRPEAASVRGLRLALADAALAAKEPERALAAIAPYRNETSYDIASRRGFALLALDRPAEAAIAFRTAAAIAPSPVTRALMVSSEISALDAMGDKAAAKSTFASAMTTGALAAAAPADLAYTALQVGDNRAAAAAFAKAKADGTLPARADFDAGYNAARLGESAAALGYFKAGLDAAAAGETDVSPQARFDVRRKISDMERTWGAYASATYGAVGVMPSSTVGAVPITGARSVDRIAQVGTELYWRPPEIGYQNGSLVELFGRVFETLYDKNDGPTGISTIQTYAGARWKPLGGINLVLEASRLWAIGDNARNDYLVRAAYSAGQGTDLRVDVPAWMMWQVYGEADRYFETPETVLSFEGRIGRSYRLDGIADGFVVTPFAALGGGYDTILATPGAVGAGPGISGRLWFNSDTYHAPRSYLDLSVQYRFKIAGGDNARGVFAGATLAY